MRVRCVCVRVCAGRACVPLSLSLYTLAYVCLCVCGSTNEFFFFCENWGDFPSIDKRLTGMSGTGFSKFVNVCTCVWVCVGVCARENVARWGNIRAPCCVDALMHYWNNKSHCHRQINRESACTQTHACTTILFLHSHTLAHTTSSISSK